MNLTLCVPCAKERLQWTMTQETTRTVVSGTFQQLEIPKVGLSSSIAIAIFDAVGARWAARYLSIVLACSFLFWRVLYRLNILSSQTQQP